MKLNGIDFSKFTNQELVQLCFKYNLIYKSKKYDRQDLLNLIKDFLIDRLNKKKSPPDPIIKSLSVESDKKYKRRNYKKIRPPF